MRDNLDEIIEKLKPREESILAQSSPVKRRMISLGVGGRPRKFTGVISGSDVLRRPVGDGSSSSIDMGPDLPSPQEMVRREETAERQKEFFKNKDKFPLPKKRDRRPDDLPGR